MFLIVLINSPFLLVCTFKCDQRQIKMRSSDFVMPITYRAVILNWRFLRLDSWPDCVTIYLVHEENRQFTNF